MAEEQQSPSVSKKSRPRNLVGSLAVVVIAITGWFIWQQLADAQRAHPLHARGPGPAPSAPNFDMSHATIPVDKVMRGGPPKDGIPALTDAKFATVAEAHFMNDDDRVIGVAIGNEAKAYPHKILDYHEAVNDRVGGQDITATYCPLCDSSTVFDRQFGGQVHEFGISGLLFNSNVLLYDRAKTGPESLWSQMASAAVTSAKSGQALRRLPLEVTSWKDWKTRYPQTLVLSTDTGHQRNYSGGAYGNYFSSPRLMFPVEPLDNRLPPKTPVLGITSGTTHRAYSLASFENTPGGTFGDQLDGRQLTLSYSPEHRSLRITSADEGLEWTYSFWFAWSAFYPETDIYQPQ